MSPVFVLHLFLSFLAGGLLGGLYFGGLWWTVQRLMDSNRPYLFIIASFVVRTAAVVVGFYLLLAAGWPQMLAALAGFLTSRTVTTWNLSVPKS